MQFLKNLHTAMSTIYEEILILANPKSSNQL